MKHPAGKLNFENLEVTFIVDEDMANYTSIWNWIRDNGNAETGGEVEGLGYSGAQLEIHTSSHNTNFVIDFGSDVLKDFGKFLKKSREIDPDSSKLRYVIKG